MMKVMKESIKEMANQNPLGFTVDLTTLKKIAGGISVAYLETQNSFGDEGLEKVGGWLDEDSGYFYFDSVRIFTNLEAAIQFGRENKQIAIFDITNLRLIKL